MGSGQRRGWKHLQPDLLVSSAPPLKAFSWSTLFTRICPTVWALLTVDSSSGLGESSRHLAWTVFRQRSSRVVLAKTVSTDDQLTKTENTSRPSFKNLLLLIH